MSSLPLVGCDWAGYRLRAVLGRGGMSTVYKAEHPRLGRIVALKIMAPELAADDVFRARFLEESRTAASLNHPGIIPIYDVGPYEDLLYIAMHYVTGSDLRAVLKAHGRISPSQALSLIGQTARALDAAHRHGLVHRDVKPGNILVERGEDDDDPDHVYLADFGITKHEASSSGLTSTGHLMGTIDYVAPEQIQGRSADSRADIYSLSCVLYECLTGHVPFDKDLDAAVLWAHIGESPPMPSAVQPDLPRGIDDVIRRALAKEPDDRYQTCRDLVAAARSALPALDEHPPTVLARHSDPDGGTSRRPASIPPSPPDDRHTKTWSAGYIPPHGTESAPPRRRKGPSRRLMALGGALMIIAAAIGAWAATNVHGGAPRANVHGGAPRAKVQGGAPRSPSPAQVAGGWLLGHDSPVAAQQLHAAVLHGRIWVAGGLTGPEDATAKTEFYDPTIETWSPGPPLPIPLHHAMMVTYRNTPVVIGGFEPRGGKVMGVTSARVLFLNRAQNGWVDGPKLHFARAAGAAAVVGNKIVVAGGRTAGTEKQVTPTEVYDGTSWHDAARIPIPVDHLAAASDGTHLYVAGGRKIAVTASTAAVQRFDPATDQWTQLKAMPDAASDLGAAIVDGQLITVGGESPASVLNTVRAYNLTTSTWSTLPNLAVARHGTAVAAIGNTLYAIDGAAQPGHNASTPTVQILRFAR